MHSPDIITSITQHPEWLFQKMAGRFEGWSIRDGITCRDVPLNTLDYFAVRILAKTIEHNERTMLCMPRITPGVTLSLASYLTINRFITKEKQGVDALALMFSGFQSIQISDTTPVVIVTKNRALRDMYLKSELRFGGHTFSYKNFPLFRLNRSGDLIPLVQASRESRFNIAPVIFYHLDEIEDIPSKMRGAVVLAEIESSLQQGTIKRFERFLDQIEPQSVLAISSSFAGPIITQLRKSNFKPIVVRPENVLKYSGTTEDFPSFSSAMGNVPSLTEFNIHPVHDEVADQYIQRLHVELNTISDQLKGDLPPVFYMARTMLAILRNICVPLESYEQARKQGGYLKSIKFLLQKNFTSRYMDMNPAQEAVIAPIWGALGDDFFGLYNHLLSSPTKYLALLDMYKQNKISDDDLIVFFDTLQPAIFRQILIEEGIASGEALTRLVCPKDISRNGIKADRILTTGLWQVKDEATLASCLPNEIEVLAYQSEYDSLKSAVRRLQELNHGLGSVDTLGGLGFNISESDYRNMGTWILPGDITQKLLSEDQKNESEPNFTNEFDEYLEEDEILDLEIESNDESENRNFYVVETMDGDIYRLDASRDILVYSDDNNSVVSKHPSGLKEGDVLLALNDESNKEIFLEISQRTKDLTGADKLILAEWESALRTIRLIKETDGEQLIFQMLRLLQCNKADITIRQWISGFTMAPNDDEDIQSMLRAAGKSNYQEMAPLIGTEIDKVRKFHRKLGKRLRAKLSEAARGEDQTSKDSLDYEVDEILDLTTPVTIADITGPTKTPLASKELLVLM